MSTRKLILPVGSGTIPIWIYGGPSTPLAENGGFMDMAGLPDGSIFLRNMDASLRETSLFSVFGKGGSKGTAFAIIDPNIMPNPVPAIGGLWSVSYNAVVGGNITAPATAATVQTALNLISTVSAAGGVTVSGATGGPYTVTFNSNGAQLLFVMAVNTLTVTNSRISAITSAYVTPGSPSTQCVQTINVATGEGQALGILIGTDGTVQQRTLGSMTNVGSPPSPINAILSDSVAPVSIAGATGLFIGTRQASFYYKGGVATGFTSFLLVNTKTGQLMAGFTGLALTKNASISVQPDFLVFSDAGSNFGFYSPHLTTNNSTTATLSYLVTWPSINPAAIGTVQHPTFIGSNFTPPAFSYGATGINAPFLVSPAGAFVSQFASARLAMARPASLGAGVFLQDCYGIRPGGDPVAVGSPEVQTNTFFTRVGNVVTVTVQITSLLTLPQYQYDVWGGSAGGYQTVALTTDLTQIGNAIALLFPDCTMSQVTNSSGSANNWTLGSTVTITQPAGATYFPYLAGRAYYDASGNFGTVNTTQTDYAFVTIADSAGGHLSHVLAPSAAISSLGITTFGTPDSTALAVSGSTICHVCAFKAPTSDQNYNWIVTLPGIAKLNISTSRSAALTGQGQNLFTGLYTQCQVAAVPFKSGFAIALPYLPRFNGTLGAPLNYSITAGKIGATPVVVKCPVIVIDSLGNVDTAFDANLWTNFWSLPRTDGMRFGPNALVVSGGHLYFGSHYTPTYLNVAGPVPSPIDLLGNVLNPPTFDPFNAPGLGYEVLCSCDTSGNRVLPPTHS